MHRLNLKYRPSCSQQNFKLLILLSTGALGIAVAASAKACAVIKTRPQAICVAGALKSKINNYDSVAAAAGHCKAVTSESQAICVSAALLSPISTYDSIEGAAKDCKVVDQ